MNRPLIRRDQRLLLRAAGRDWAICAAAAAITFMVGTALGLRLPLAACPAYLAGLTVLLGAELAVGQMLDRSLRGTWPRVQRALLATMLALALAHALADRLLDPSVLLGLAGLQLAITGALYVALEDGRVQGAGGLGRGPARRHQQRVILVEAADGPSAETGRHREVEAYASPCGLIAIDLSGGSAGATCSFLAHQADRILDAARGAGASVALFRDEPWPSPLRELALLLRYGGLGVVTRDALCQEQQGIAVLPTMRATEAFLQPPFDHARRQTLAVKRLVDLVLAGAALVLLAPVLALAALAVRIDSPGPVIYRQFRTGRNTRPFAILKLRTMCSDAERDGAPRWASRADPRITRVGRILRRTRLDELPQLVNVLRGEMSLVGPRPERPEFVEMLRAEIPGYEFRHLVRPGLTGWAQINYPYGASVEDARAKLGFDLYYVRACSLRLDLRIMARTLRVVVRGEGV